MDLYLSVPWIKNFAEVEQVSRGSPGSEKNLPEPPGVCRRRLGLLVSALKTTQPSKDKNLILKTSKDKRELHRFRKRSKDVSDEQKNHHDEK